MKALSAVSSTTPISVLSQKSEPKKNLLLPTIVSFKSPTFPSLFIPESVSSLSRNLKGGLGILSLILSTDLAKALTYDEALQQSVGGGGSVGSDIDISGILDNAIDFVVDNPILTGGGLAILALPLLVSQLLSKPKPWGVESAKTSYAKLGDDKEAQLLDIRVAQDIKQVGSPDIRGFKKKPVSVVYRGEDKPGFLKKLYSKFKEPEKTTLFILDKFDGNSELVAELVTSNGFKAAYAIRDGAEGSRGWAKSGLPWILPGNTWSLRNLTATVGGAFGDPSEALPLTLGVVAAAGLGLLSFTEVETILQVLGSVALIQFVSKKVLFAEDRKQTIQELEDILNTKVAPKDFVGDIQQIGMALLPSAVINKALPAPVEAVSPEAETVLKVNNAPPKIEPESEPEVNSVPKARVAEDSLPGISRSLSPFPNYPDYKPPSSPIPSQP